MSVIDSSRCDQPLRAGGQFGLVHLDLHTGGFRGRVQRYPADLAPVAVGDRFQGAGLVGDLGFSDEASPTADRNAGNGVTVDPELDLLGRRVRLDMERRVDRNVEGPAGGDIGPGPALGSMT